MKRDSFPIPNISLWRALLAHSPYHIIHLFNFRRYKRVLFTNVRFLQELKEETTKISRLKHLLVLLTRLLAITFIVLAFAQPVIPGGDSIRSNLSNPVSVYI
ncbi:MAG: BatA domain-containing protein [Bacteroidetes bacterium]|nr:BatA domain-containing protein [Bacteroidota bacterium]